MYEKVNKTLTEFVGLDSLLQRPECNIITLFKLQGIFNVWGSTFAIFWAYTPVY
jgi:hypothetical protein